MGLAALPAAAARPAGSLDDPDCEADPFQAGCDPACADPTVDCHHPPCPTNLAGQALETGGVFMSYTLNSFSDTKIYRAVGDGAFEAIDYLPFPSPRHIDHDTEPGVVYRYQVSSVGLHQYNETVPAEGESPRCETIEVTAIPVFPSAVAATAGLGAALAGYVALRRR